MVRSAGKTWVCRQVAEDKFTRAEVNLDRSTARGWLVTQAISAGGRLVTIGAQMLLSEEQKSQIQILEEAQAR